MYDDYYVDDYDTESSWLICINCEQEFLMDELFFDDFEDSLATDSYGIECPFCKSREMRKVGNKWAD